MGVIWAHEHIITDAVHNHLSDMTVGGPLMQSFVGFLYVLVLS